MKDKIFVVKEGKFCMNSEVLVMIDSKVFPYMKNRRFCDAIQFEINQMLVGKMDSRILYMDSCEINLCCQDNVICVDMIEDLGGH